MNLEQIKLAIKQWRDYNFPKATAESQLLGVVEELGELSHAHLKESQGIRKMDYRHAKQDAIGDMMIFLLNYCELQDLDVMECINIAWAEASKRDWVKYPKNGVSE
jgi:NTP pyrophosphatase (non-canonical NTP hydrolase)